jgi:hypothetical protein
VTDEQFVLIALAGKQSLSEVTAALGRWIEAGATQPVREHRGKVALGAVDTLAKCEALERYVLTVTDDCPPHGIERPASLVASVRGFCRGWRKGWRHGCQA